MARSYRQRFDVRNASPGATGGTPDEQAKARADAVEKLVQAEERAMADFREGLISADDALAEFATAVRKYARAGGIGLGDRQSLVERAGQSLDAQAAAMGVPGVSRDLSAAEQIEKARREAVEAFTASIITADEALKRQTAAIDRFGESAGMTVDERARAKEKAQNELTVDSWMEGEPGPGGGGGPGGGLLDQILGQVGGKFGIPKNALAGMGGGGGGGGLGGLMGGGGGGAGAGGLSGVASAAGPLAVVTAISKAIEGFYDSVAETTRKMSAVSQSIAGNDGVGAITGAVEGAAGTITSKVPVLGEAMQAQVEMYTGFVKEFDKVTEAFKKRGEELSKYSGPIAGAKAESDVMKLLADINEAQRLGNEYGAIIRAKTEAQVEFQKALTPIKEMMMQKLIPVLEFVTLNLRGVNVVLNAISDTNKGISEGIKSLVGASEGGDKLLTELKDWVSGHQAEQRDKQHDRQKAFLDDLFNVGRMGEPVRFQKRRDDPPDPQPLDLFDDNW